MSSILTLQYVLIKILDLSTQFLASIRHHTDVLLGPTLAQLRSGLHQYRSMLGKEHYFKGRIPSIGDLLDLAATGLENLRLTVINDWMELHLKPEDYAAPLGAMVPKAAPREILISLLLNHPRMLQRMTSVGADTFLGEFYF